MGSVSFYGLVISKTNRWEDYSNYFGNRVGDFQELGYSSLLTQHSWPQNCLDLESPAILGLVGSN